MLRAEGAGETMTNRRMQGATRRRLLAGLAGTAGLGLLPRLPLAQASPTFLRIGTASTAGIYFPLGSLVATAISNPPGSRECDRGGSCGVPGLVAVAQSTDGSVHNVAALAGGTLETAFCQADVAYWAFHGEGPYEGAAPVTSLRAIANLYPEVVQLVVRSGANIRSVPDLRGRRISLDRDGSGTQVDARLILDAWDLGPDDLEAHYVPANVAASMMRNGELDGFFLVAGIPTPSLVDLARDLPINLVPIVGEPIDALRRRYPFFGPADVPPGTYPSSFPIVSLSVGAQWLTTAALDEELVYGITRALWHPSNRSLLDEGHPKARQITLDTALNGLGVPLHAGARRYYEELGITVIEPYAPPRRGGGRGTGVTAAVPRAKRFPHCELAGSCLMPR